MLKSKNRRTLLFLLILYGVSMAFSVLLGCSSDDPEPGCFKEQNRKIIGTVSNALGTIRGPASDLCSDYVIVPDLKVESRSLGLFAACNLLEEFKNDGAKVIFSGYIYESFETEDICADFFEITSIKLSNP